MSEGPNSGFHSRSAACLICGAVTDRYIVGEPICRDCDDSSRGALKLQAWKDAAKMEWWDLIGDAADGFADIASGRGPASQDIRAVTESRRAALERYQKALRVYYAATSLHPR